MIRTHDIGSGTGNAGDSDGTGANILYPSNGDPMSASSYNFGPTDAAIKNIRDAGAEVYFRIGRSNSNVGTPPADFDKYAQAMKQVVLHYNQGWANGFMYGIKYFEIWNEPDFQPFWTGTPEQYRQLYKKVALAIREAEPNAIIGGPTSATFSDEGGLRATFLQFVKDNNLPLDFYSFHKYTNSTNDPYEFARMAMTHREELDKFGFTKTEIINSEWETSLMGDVVLGGDAGRAGFVAQSLIYMQNVGVGRSFVYGRIASTPTKENLGFSAVSKLNATPIKLCTKTQFGEDNGVCRAGRAQRGRDEADASGRHRELSDLQIVDGAAPGWRCDDGAGRGHDPIASAPHDRLPRYRRVRPERSRHSGRLGRRHRSTVSDRCEQQLHRDQHQEGSRRRATSGRVDVQRYVLGASACRCAKRPEGRTSGSRSPRREQRGGRTQRELEVQC
jgi:hypothetical protein